MFSPRIFHFPFGGKVTKVEKARNRATIFDMAKIMPLFCCCCLPLYYFCYSGPLWLATKILAEHIAKVEGADLVRPTQAGVN